MKKLNDEYIWENYTQEYKNQIISDVAKTNTMLVKKFKIENDKLIFDESEKLHNHWKEIYSLVVEKRVKSVMEVGCGSGQHIKNIKTIKPDIIVHGCDLLQTQIDWGKEYFGFDDDFLNDIIRLDFTLEDVPKILDRKYDFVYSQVVITHLNYEKAVKFIRNMLNISNRYILMIERQNDHNYMEIFELLRNEGYEFKVEYTNNYLNTGLLLTKKKESK